MSVARRGTNDYEELMTARPLRDCALQRRATGCDSDLRSLTVSNTTGIRPWRGRSSERV